jgi:hypothetical protein
MNVESKTSELAQLIRRYLDGSESLDRLNDFVWDVIDFFTDGERDELPPVSASEKEFWYTIWRIQHLVGEPDDSIKSELPTLLSYLTEDAQLPTECEGRRPVPSKKR